MVMNPKDSYVYVHRRKTDGSVFYVGKGTGNRAWSASKRNKHWVSVTSKHGCDVQILQDGLQSWYAYEVEVEVLSRLLEDGVKLTNKTDGGDGCMGTSTRTLKNRLPSAAQRRNGKSLSTVCLLLNVLLLLKKSYGKTLSTSKLAFALCVKIVTRLRGRKKCLQHQQSGGMTKN